MSIWTSFTYRFSRASAPLYKASQTPPLLLLLSAPYLIWLPGICPLPLLNNRQLSAVGALLREITVTTVRTVVGMTFLRCTLQILNSKPFIISASVGFRWKLRCFPDKVTLPSSLDCLGSRRRVCRRCYVIEFHVISDANVSPQLGNHPTVCLRFRAARSYSEGTEFPDAQVRIG